MGQHHKDGIKGNGYKREQIRDKLIQKRRRYIKLASVTDQWMIDHGYRKREDGKWERS
jgi:hypothetical protein